MNDYAKFNHCFERLMILEGHKFTNDPDDAGGETKFGISKLAYPDEDIEHLNQGRARFLYHRDYYLPLKLDSVRDEEICFQLFECAVHMDPPQRPRRSVKIAQGALILLGRSVTFDGAIGPETIDALNTYPHKEALLKWMNLLQGAALIVGTQGENDLVALVKARLQQLQTYARGWGRRIEI